MFLNIFIPSILVVAGYMYYQSNSSSLTYVKSTKDKNTYLVRNLPDAAEAANVLATLREKLTSLVDYLYTKHPEKPSIKRLKQRFNGDNLSESEPNTEYTSYSVNKGEQIIFCIRSKDDKSKLEDVNTLTFVALHELAHIMTESVGHTQEFWDNFKYLLKKAIKLGIYTIQEFHKDPVKYCGIMITDTPLRSYDASVDDE